MATKLRARRHRRISPTSESRIVQWVLTGLSLLFMGVILVLPLYSVFHEAFAKGIGTFFAAFAEPDARAVIRPALLVGAIAVLLNVVFRLAAPGPSPSSSSRARPSSSP
ncbi:hypothetical protein N8D56_20815 [Devosia sp. A8/3-2]|nr:hypothetical protein N8D56_20815 [Devosia sp. A8/3-2]